MASLCTFQLALHQPQRLASREDCLTALDSNKLGKTANYPPEKAQVKSLTAADMVDDPTRNVQLDKHSTNASNPSPAPWLQLDGMTINCAITRGELGPVPCPPRCGMAAVTCFGRLHLLAAPQHFLSQRDERALPFMPPFFLRFQC